jgi:predicted metal-binding membrane protein
VLLEKLAPQGQLIARASGVLLVGAGAVVLLRAF